MPIVAPDETRYLRDGVPAFERRFLRAMSFHQPEGLAAVLDETGAYHVDSSCRPRYPQRYREAFGFYGGLATVRDDRGFFHIDASGEPVHSNRYVWAGNFQEDLCAVQDETGFHHVRRDGTAAYPDRYSYAGDFRMGLAAVHGPRGAFHIFRDGTPLHDRTFLTTGAFHKGYAVASDEEGVFHVDKNGRPAYDHRFRSAEPFYNGVALCSTRAGRLVRVRENGFYHHLSSTRPRATLAGIRSRLEAGARVALFLRHAERPPITSGWGLEVPLTDRGVLQAHRLGEIVGGRAPVTVWSSPVPRCVQTGRAFANGAGAPQEPVVSTLLGEPGAFVDPTRRDELRVGPREFGAFATAYIEEGRAPGMRPLEVACEELTTHLTQQLGVGFTLFVTHDLFVAGLLRFLGLKRPTREDWADFLEGVCFTVSADGRVEAERILPLEDLGGC
jgi:broad specificity phosphatase PhoE